MITFAATILEDLSFVMSFGGATLGNALIYILPAIMFKSVVKNMGDGASTALKKETYFATFSMLLGIFMGAVWDSTVIEISIFGIYCTSFLGLL